MRMKALKLVLRIQTPISQVRHTLDLPADPLRQVGIRKRKTDLGRVLCQDQIRLEILGHPAGLEVPRTLRRVTNQKVFQRNLSG